MAVALVAQTTGSSASLANATATIPATTAGNLVVAIYDRSGGLGTGALTSVTDSAAQTWTLATRGAVSSGAHTRVEVWYKENSASITSVTFNSATAQTNSWNIQEWSGALTASPLDVASADNSGVAATTAVATPSATTATANDLVIAGTHFALTTATLDAGPFTALANFDDGSSGSGRAAYLLNAAVGPYSASWTLGVAKAAGVFTAGFKASVTLAGESTPGPLVVVRMPWPRPGFIAAARGPLADDPVLTSPEPIVVAAPTRPRVATVLLYRSSLEDVVVAPAGVTPQPIAVTAQPKPRPGVATILRGPLFDAATPQPIVVATALRRPASAMLLIRGCLADDPVLTTPEPIVVAVPRPRPPGGTLLLRAPLEAAEHICTTPRPTTGATVRPAAGTTTYAFAATLRPSTGDTARPNTGVTEALC